MLGLCGLACALAGCAGKGLPRLKREVPPAAVAHDAPADPASLTLDQIEPRPVLDKSTAATRPSANTRPPVESLQLFAQARDALLSGRRYTAIGALERAIALDPHSYELYYALGEAYQMGRAYDDRAIAAMERAAAVDPDHLELQTDLGRQYLAKGDVPRATEHLRLALQTSQYDTDDSTAAVADYFLARVLQLQGYDRAALRQYARLLERAKDRPLTARRDAGLAFIISDRLQRDVGDLYAKHGLHEYALSLYQAAAEREPTSVELQTRVVRTLSALGRHDEALRRADDVVVQTHASAEAVTLLGDVARAAAGGDESAATDALRRLHEQRPGDRDVLFALVDRLAAADRRDEADRLLARAAERSTDDSDADFVRRRFDLRLNANDLAGAARFLIDTLARRPDAAPELDALWPELVRHGGGPARFRSSAVVELQVPPQHQAAKWYAASRVAARGLHDRAARHALERATQFTPPFAPAFRDLMARAWSRPDVDEAEKRRRADELTRAAAAGGDAVLADELNGLSLLYQQRAAEAAVALGRAAERAGNAAGPDLQHALATAFRRSGDAPRFERLLWKLVSDRPGYEDAYLDLFEYYSDAGQTPQAERVLTAWRSALPRSVAARLRQAASDFRAGRVSVAEQGLSALFDEAGDEAAVVASLRAFYARGQQPEKYLAKLEERQPREPGNLAVAGALAEAYAQQGRSTDAARMLDAARVAVGNDPDLLYQLAHLATRAGLDELGDRLLADVLDLDATHAPAANDLGYRLAEQGRDLGRAEQLARQAVNLEPHNGAYLDSLGWVLYKRSKFPEARDLLGRAVAASTTPDPVMLDHLADAHYRAGDAKAAAELWDRALKRLEETGVANRTDLKELRTNLRRKTQQAGAGEAVDVAPILVDPAAAAEAGAPMTEGAYRQAQSR